MSIQTVLNKFRELSPDIINEITNLLLQEFKEKYPNINWEDEENIDFIVRPLVSVMLVSEVEKDTILSLSSIDGIVNNTLLDDQQKLIALQKYSEIIGLQTSSKDWKTLLNEIKFFVKNRWYNIKHSIYDALIVNFNLKKVYIVDTNSKEMVRNSLPIIPVPTNLIPYFSRNQNVVNCISSAFNRVDIEMYKNSVNNSIKIPNFIDVYLFKDIIKTKIKANRINSKYILGSKYWIYIEHKTKDIIVEQTENQTINGFQNKEIKVFIPNGEEEEEFIVWYYNLPTEKEIKIDGLIDNANTMIKGYFPLFLDFIVLSEEPVDFDYIDSLIDEYLESINYDYRYFNLTELNKKIKHRYKALISTDIKGKLFFSTNLWEEQDIKFPISFNDFRLKQYFPTNQLSDNTIIIQKNSVKVNYES